METRSLELTVTSAKGLQNVSKTDVFVTVKLSGDPKFSDQREQRTQVAKDNGSSPKWSNDVMRFVIDQALAEANRLVITFKIKKSEQRSRGGDKEIGEVHVPVKELLDHLGNDKAGKRYVTYRIKKASGKLRGDLSFTYSLSEYREPTTAGGSRYPVNKPVRPAAMMYPAHEPVYPAATTYLAQEPVCPTAATYQPVLNRPVLSQLLPTIGSFSYHQSPIYPPVAQPEIFPPTVAACFPGLYPPQGYRNENPPAMYPPLILPGLSTSCTAPEGYPTVVPVQTQPEVYPPMSSYGF